MFHKVKSVLPQDNYILLVSFSEGVSKTYDVKPLFKKWKIFNDLKKGHAFFDVKVDQGGYGISWSDNIDLSCDELFFNGKIIKTPFDGLIAFTEACQLWNLNESTLRKAVSYGKLVEGIWSMAWMSANSENNGLFPKKQWKENMEAEINNLLF